MGECTATSRSKHKLYWICSCLTQTLEIYKMMFAVGILISTYWKFMGEPYHFRSTLIQSIFNSVPRWSICLQLLCTVIRTHTTQSACGFDLCRWEIRMSAKKLTCVLNLPCFLRCVNYIYESHVNIHSSFADNRDGGYFSA